MMRVLFWAQITRGSQYRFIMRDGSAVLVIYTPSPYFHQNMIGRPHSPSANELACCFSHDLGVSLTLELLPQHQPAAPP